MKIKQFTKINESSYSDFLKNYKEEIENSIKLLVKLESEDYLEKCDPETLEKKLSVYDTNVLSKIEDWIYDTPTKEEIAEFALNNQDRWGTEPQMVLYAIEDYASTCGIYLNDDENENENEDDNGFYEGSFQFDDDEENENKIDNFTAKYYDNYDDEEEPTYEYDETNLKKIQLFEDFLKNND